MSFRNILIVCMLAFLAGVLPGCSAAKVTRVELEALKPGNIVVFRYDKEGGKTWRYSEKITRIEGDTIYYYPSEFEAPSGAKDVYKTVTRFVEDRELSRTKDEYYKFETEQGGSERRTIMWIE